MLDSDRVEEALGEFFELQSLKRSNINGLPGSNIVFSLDLWVMFAFVSHGKRMKEHA